MRGRWPVSGGFQRDDAAAGGSVQVRRPARLVDDGLDVLELALHRVEGGVAAPALVALGVPRERTLPLAPLPLASDARGQGSTH
ncbi:hypothetical protein [Nonomuraea sp. NPDC046570]|uniref:hypothetical protein n=1 Tax=Nonomuraea sp. NPDC046570 TaxID=3155255 RepID=UPI00340FA199